jgi:hypothetical protein
MMMIVARICVFVLAVWATACQPATSFPEAADRSGPPDSIPEIATAPEIATYPELRRKLAPILESIQSARAMLQQDSGTVAADSAFVTYRRELRDLVQEVVATFNDREFQANVWPVGAAAMRRWREEQRPELRPTSEEEARADSIVAVLMANAIWPERAEGDTYFLAKEAILLERLGTYLTGGMRDFLRMQADEQQRPTAQDAGLMIALDELGERIRSAERFLEAHPESLVRDVVQSRYSWYLAVYLAGLPNSRAFDWRTGDLRPEWRESMEQYAIDHEGTESGRLVSNYLDLLAGSGFSRSAEVDTFLSELWANIRLVSFP